MLTYENNTFTWTGLFSERQLPKDAGFEWNDDRKRWETGSAYVAYLLWKDDPHMSVVGQAIMEEIDSQIHYSSSRFGGVDAHPFPGFYTFQESGVANMVYQFKHDRKAVLCADEQGLGKTIEALGVANELGAKRLLVICPASLRLNWVREIEKWHLHNEGASAILSGTSALPTSKTLVVSYSLAHLVKSHEPDLLIVDEAAYLRNAGTKRTKLILGDARKNWPGFVDKAPTIFLTGTPFPGGKPTELWPLLYRCAPDVIDHMKYWDFARKFCTMETPDYGMDPIITGAKNTKELYVRLRGSGFMVRRLKKDVLKDLPQKRYKLVVFPKSGETAKIIRKEAQFDAAEIIRYGIPAGSALPELRREMALAKIPECVEYVTDLLEGGTDKAVLFTWHVDATKALAAGLSKYEPVVIVGSTPAKSRQEYVDKFQQEDRCRLFIGNSAAQEGITLTAAHDVVLIEPSWTPGDNDQRVDRLHRIGQNEAVIVHILVVEESLDAKILGSAARKAGDAEAILEGGVK